MFLTRIASTVSGRSTKGARRSYAPDGKMITEFFLACGNGTVKYPTMYVKVCVWEDLAEKALAVINRKGLNIEASGFLQVKQYEGKYGKSMLIELMDVRELRLFNRDGELEKVMNNGKMEGKEVK